MWTRDDSGRSSGRREERHHLQRTAIRVQVRPGIRQEGGPVQVEVPHPVNAPPSLATGGPAGSEDRLDGVGGTGHQGELPEGPSRNRRNLLPALHRLRPYAAVPDEGAIDRNRPDLEAEHRHGQLVELGCGQG